MYTNNRGKELIPPPDRPDAARRHIADFHNPCPFCRIGNRGQDKFVIRNFFRPGSGKAYQLNGKLIVWTGESALIMYELDITDKKREEERHRKIAEELKTTFGSIPCGLSVYHLEEKKILPVFRNSAFFEIAGCSSKHICLGVRPDDLSRLKEKIRAAVRRGAVVRDTDSLYQGQCEAYRWFYPEGMIRTDSQGRRPLYRIDTDVHKRMPLKHKGSDAKRGANGQKARHISGG